MVLYTMSIEWVWGIACCAFLMSAATMYLNKKIFDMHEESLKRVWSRVTYMNIAMSHHSLIPLPWEVDDIEHHGKNSKKLKRDGNVVYIGEEE